MDTAPDAICEAALDKVIAPLVCELEDSSASHLLSP